MGLFAPLLRLYSNSRSSDVVGDSLRTPTEDFFTEVVGFLGEEYPQVIIDWLNRYAFNKQRTYQAVGVRTQCRFNPPQGFTIQSRVDLVLELRRSDGKTDVVFIESKVASKEGWEQLNRYTKTLEEQKNDGEKWLFYVTRHYEPKPKRNLPSSVQFDQIRWFQLHRTLKQQAPDPLLNEVIKFMEQSGMSQGDRFTAQDSLAIQHLKSATALMQATLADEVSAKLAKICGKKLSTDLADLREHGRYITWAWFSAKWWVGLGFFPSTQGDDYPAVGMVIEIDPSSKLRTAIAATLLRAATDQQQWKPYNLDQPHLWSGIAQRRSLSEFLSQKDHVAAIRKYFLELIDELARFKKTYATLPWAP